MPYKPKIVTRSISTTTVTTDSIPKNAALTNNELDSNFLNLQAQSFALVGDDSTGIDIRSGDTIKLTGAGGATVTAVGDTITITASGGGGGGSIGDLSVVGSTILAPTNGDLGLMTSGIGYVHVKDKLAVAKEIFFDDYGAAEVEPPGNGSRMKILDDEIDINAGRASIDSFRIWSRGGSGSQLYILEVDSTGDGSDFGHFKVYGLSYPQSDGTAGQAITTDGAGTLSFSGINKVGNLSVTNSTISTELSNADISITSNGTGKTKITNLNYSEAAPYSVTYAATITPDVANGNIQTVTLTGNVTFSAFSNPVAGQSLTLFVVQDGTGSRTLTSTMKFAAASKTLSTAANSIDIITAYYDGTNYYANLAKAYA